MAPKKLPDFDLLARVYKGDGWDADQVKKAIGGSVNSPDIDDTCIVRVSEPLNALGHLIPPWTKAFRTRRGTDKRWYGLRVAEFWPYMIRTYGPPTVHGKKPLDRKAFQGIPGIIGFKVSVFKGSTGHFALWDGSKLLYAGGPHDYFAISDEGALWQAGNTRWTQAEV